MEDTNKGKWGNDSITPLDCHNIGKEILVRKEHIALLKMCEEAKKKAAKTKKFKGKINKNNEKFNGDFVNNADKNGI